MIVCVCAFLSIQGKRKKRALYLVLLFYYGIARVEGLCKFEKNRMESEKGVKRNKNGRKEKNFF